MAAKYCVWGRTVDTSVTEAPDLLTSPADEQRVDGRLGVEAEGVELLSAGKAGKIEVGFHPGVVTGLELEVEKAVDAAVSRLVFGRPM